MVIHENYFWNEINLFTQPTISLVENIYLYSAVPYTWVKVQKFPKYWTLENNASKISKNPSLMVKYLSMESQPQNPEFRNNPENFPPCL